MYLPDPRRYPRVNPQNPVIRALMAYLTAPDAATAADKRCALVEQLTSLLAAADHYALNGALTQAPSQEAYKALWQVLREVVEQPPPSGAEWNVLFTIPVILVAGARSPLQLPGRLPEPAAVLALLRQHGVVDADADLLLSPALVHPGDMAAINPALLAQWRDLPYAEAAAALGKAVREAPVQLKNEGVFLRYLVGLARQRRDGAAPLRLGGQVGAWGMPLAQLIGDALQQEGLTLFAIPRAPQPWLAAQDSARATQLETQLQVAVSNAVRSIRSKRRTPAVVLAAHEGGELRITFSSQEDGERWEGFVWPLAPLDSVEQIHGFAEALLRECQVDDVRVIDTVQPDKDGELPFFVTAHIPAKHVEQGS
ncbi:DUF2863 family protein [Chitiniphilus purpureus]|uniref:DUF2863 family protein n=1 Tax=Chitiniphilus purpureus TaxID=2981137 RepID=A0ABY6DHW1_9NEIS|nr:DUF2863 family protein [Chitiniphilus sp. CD1]UXY13929.1 DUF2863 family protein [Chitiniphilus sp. CD1]